MAPPDSRSYAADRFSLPAAGHIHPIQHEGDEVLPSLINWQPFQSQPTSQQSFIFGANERTGSLSVRGWPDYDNQYDPAPLSIPKTHTPPQVGDAARGRQRPPARPHSRRRQGSSQNLPSKKHSTAALSKTSQHPTGSVLGINKMRRYKSHRSLPPRTMESLQRFKLLDQTELRSTLEDMDGMDSDGEVNTGSSLRPLF
jgi:hypothetical protein